MEGSEINMSSIRIRKRGKSYEYCFDSGKVNNKRKRITKSGFKTKNEAQEAGTAAYEEYIRTGVISKECKCHIMIIWIFGMRIIARLI